jgi:hypothetical protein
LTVGRRDRAFLSGLLTGAATVLLVYAALALFPSGGLALPTREALAPPLLWLWRNLGHSLWVFSLVLVLYLRALGRLRAALAEGVPARELAQAEQLVDVWTSLFFGVGVIWTAIGMRAALIHALGDPLAAGHADAAAILERLVNGGILLALSTTIFGGVGGYLMRVVKVVTVGPALKGEYERAAHASASRVEDLLTEIRDRMAPTAGAIPYGGYPDDEISLGDRVRAPRA